MEELIVSLSEILDGNIMKKPDGHYYCMIRIKLKSEDVQNFLKKRILSLKNGEKLIFKGIIYKPVKPVNICGDWEAVITAYSAGFLLDQKLSTYTYQNKSPDEIIRAISGIYKGDCMTDSRISKLPKSYYLQYEETDWAFLRRILTPLNAAISVDWKSDRPKLYIHDLSEALDKRQLLEPVYFYRGQSKGTPWGVRGYKSLIRSGMTETLYESSDASYLDDRNVMPPGWFLVDCEGEDCDGFRAITLRRNNSLIVAFAGSNDWKDVGYDLACHFADPDSDIVKSMIDPTRKYISEALRKYPSADIYITGHSLGGHLALEAALHLVNENQFGRVKQIEVFNGFGATSELATEERLRIIQSKTATREFRKDFVSEINKVVDNRNIYNDGHYEIVSSVTSAVRKAIMGAVGPLSVLPVEQLVVTPAYGLFINHSIKRFRQQFTYTPPQHKPPEFKNSTRKPIVLKGTVLKVTGEQFKVTFKEDRFPAAEADCFAFRKSTAYVGVTMMPVAGDTALIEFLRNADRKKNSFEAAVCRNFERKNKK